ncbi:hypothetical protein BO83DRAFT_410305 [Aspergillus eucalypticola CBS 122712]|uniref:RING-type E3 ubiquitin transferase n=1 Tax=Aspergillus eucalypticola (strain CBS 122712 / IBT 29274) TaxID=1448314 RepID=A0A317UYV3_ASPEC|nr:uncharacterized protein BO83DRAFT_410305 [Aspergillus eucalypticola CBS 122712]PWY66955.1 hypothetical protein BO83DRAFT_410305 [Aspergillus eucalypticola CBS 122712]
MVQVSSLALVGYLAPVLVTVLLFITWLTLGARRRRRRRRRLYGSTYPYSDAEMAAAAAGGQRIPRIVISQQLIEVLYPQVKYKDWLAENRNEQQRRQQQQDLSSDAIAQVRSTSGDNTSGGSPENTNININTNINDSQERCNDTGDDDPDKYTSGDNHRTCAICIDQFADDDEIRSLPCRHIFHTVCLDPWVTKKNAFCPLCKKALCGVKKGDNGSGGDRRSWPWRRQSQRASARVVSVSVPEAAVVRGSV